MANGHLEVLVEPFKENDPGAHVEAVVEALTEAGLETDMGPFATIVDGELDTILDAVRQLLASGFEAGATAIQLRIERR